jgi:hypothetical protein
MGMAAEHPVRLLETSMQNGTGRDFVREAKPARVEAVRQSRKILTFEVQLLQIEMQ